MSEVTLSEATQRSEQRNPLQTDRGLTINDAVVTSLAAQVVQEVGGAEPEIGGRGATTIPGDTSPTMGELINRVSGGNRGARGVSVDAGETAGS